MGCLSKLYRVRTAAAWGGIAAPPPPPARTPLSAAARRRRRRRQRGGGGGGRARARASLASRWAAVSVMRRLPFLARPDRCRPTSLAEAESAQARSPCRLFNGAAAPRAPTGLCARRVCTPQPAWPELVPGRGRSGEAAAEQSERSASAPRPDMDRQPQPLAACACKFMDREQWTRELAAGHRLCEAHFRLSEHFCEGCLAARLARRSQRRNLLCSHTDQSARFCAEETQGETQGSLGPGTEVSCVRYVCWAGQRRQRQARRSLAKHVELQRPNKPARLRATICCLPLSSFAPATLRASSIGSPCSPHLCLRLLRGRASILGFPVRAPCQGPAHPSPS